MSTGSSRSSDVKAEACALDPRSDAERAVAEAAAARERREAYVRGYQLAEIRKAVGITQDELAESLGVTQARVSKIENGEVSGIDVTRDYIAALGGHLDLVATLGDRTWRVA